ncbi:MAG: translation initiation factor IF-2, partial [Clostridiales bacterium]
GQGGSATGGGYRGQNPSGQGGAGKRSTGTNRTDKSAEPITTILEKPSVNYRPAKKVFVKDIVFEKASAVEKQRSNKNYNNRNTKGGRRDVRGKKEAKAIMPPVIPKKITIGETVVLGELAKTMGKSAGEIIKKLFTMGIMATINQELDAETAILLADEFGVTVELKADKIAEVMEDLVDEDADLVERPPVVTIMGHVDHGKTSLLDAIRHTNVISTEAGGITQHIGAYQVEIKGRKITFLDTPGHEAFTAMRARGAQVTDISIIVVAADDGVMPQTVEAINHSKAAGVPVIIAINKIDKPGANVDRVKQELLEHGMVSEEWGGDTVMVEVSAKARLNLEALLEMILLVSDVAELKANPDRQARGTVVEAKLDKNRGPVATLLVQKGTLHAGDTILAGAVFGKVKAMNDDKGNKVRHAGPSMPVEVLGFSEVPPAGEIFVVVKDEKDARSVAARQQSKKREEELHKTARVSLDDLFKQIAEGDIQELNLVVKADVQGSVEALNQSLYKLNTDEVKVNVIHAGVGGISESDVMLAAASNAIILGFNIVAPQSARAAAETEHVDIRLYRVIYDALEDIKKAMGGLLAPEYKENVIGHAEVRMVFKVPKAGMVAGSYVSQGKITRNAKIRVIRDNVVIAEDKIDSLRRFKDDAKEVLQGFECGIGLENFNDIKEGDVLEAFQMETIQREL